MPGVDIFNDIHGRIAMFRALMKLRGYDDHGWHPDGYKIVLLGDVGDASGPEGTTPEEQRETMEYVMDLYARGNLDSYLGNHEFNSIAYVTEGRNGYIREHTEANFGYQRDFLTAYPPGSQGHADVISLFKKFRLYDRKEGYNIVHACWSENAIEVCSPYLNEDHTLTEEAYQQFDLKEQSPVYDALRLMLWGPTYYMPKGTTIEDGRGRPIDYSRFGWWNDPDVPDEDVFYRGPSFLPKLPPEEREKVVKLRHDFQYAGQNVVFIGHYCMPYTPAILSPKVACLDFNGHMATYRWDDGDTALDPAKLICV